MGLDKPSVRRSCSHSHPVRRIVCRPHTQHSPLRRSRRPFLCRFSPCRCIPAKRTCSRCTRNLCSPMVQHIRRRIPHRHIRCRHPICMTRQLSKACSAVCPCRTGRSCNLSCRRECRCRPARLSPRLDHHRPRANNPQPFACPSPFPQAHWKNHTCQPCMYVFDKPCRCPGTSQVSCNFRRFRPLHQFPLRQRLLEFPIDRYA